MERQQQDIATTYDYMPHYRHWATVLQDGGFRLSKPESEYLIGLMHEQEAAVPQVRKTWNDVFEQYYIRYRSQESRCPSDMDTKGHERPLFSRLRVTRQEEDFLCSLLREPASVDSGLKYRHASRRYQSQAVKDRRGVFARRHVEIRFSNPQRTSDSIPGRRERPQDGTANRNEDRTDARKIETNATTELSVI